MRSRKCTTDGEGFFLSAVLKNRDDLLKKIDKHVGKIDDLLQRQSLEDAENLMQVLNVEHKEFVRSHLRYQELAGEQVNLSEEKIISDEALHHVTKVRERLAVALVIDNNYLWRFAATLFDLFFAF